MNMIEWIKKNQPIAYIGVFRHILLWLESGMRDEVFDNPSYVKPTGGKGIAMYYIHGTADRTSAFALIAERILCHLPHEIAKMILLSFDKRGQGIGIDDFAEQVLEKVKKNGDQYVILVGHSRGGLVASYFTEYLAQRHGIQVLGVITIGAPFQGSSYATRTPFCYLSKSVKQMQPGSEFLKDLQHQIKKTTSLYFHVAAANDGIVTVESACPINNEEQDPQPNINFERKFVLDRHAHLSVMSSHRLVAYLGRSLTKMIELAQLNFPGLITPVDAITPLWEVCTDITIEIINIQKRMHLYSAEGKIALLKLLHDMLIASYKENKYGANTIADFINAFLHDKTLFKGTEPIKIFSQQLNQGLYLFGKEKPDSLVVMEELIRKYQGVAMPVVNNIHLSKTVCQ